MCDAWGGQRNLLSVTRRIQNVELVALELDGQVLGENGDTAFSLLVLVVHDALSGFFLLSRIAKDTGLANQGIDAVDLTIGGI